MEITDVRVYLASQSGPTKAYVTITFDDSFVVRDIKVVDGKNGLFVAMPSRRDQKGEFKDICHPIKSEMREQIQKAVISKYQDVIS